MFNIEAPFNSSVIVRGKLVAMVFACVIIPIVIVAATLIANIRQASLAEFEYRTQAEIEHVERLFTQFLHGLRDDALFLAKSSDVTSLGPAVSTYFDKRPRMASALEISESERKVFRLFEAFGAHRKELAYVYLGTDQGGYIQWPPSTMSNYDPRTRPWYLSAIDSEVPVISPPYIDLNTGKPVVDYVVRFHAADGVKGVVGVDVFLSQLTEIIHSISFGEAGYLLLLDADNNVLADPSKPSASFVNVNELAADYPEIATLEQGFSPYRIKGQDWFVQKLVSAELGWTFIGLVPKDHVFHRVDRLIDLVLIVGAIFSGLFGFIAYRIIFKSHFAKHANPLTGLPGNLAIDEMVNGWLEKKVDFTVAYFDLDNFKPFNDHYGYSDGDRAIIGLANTIKKFADRDGNFIGHIGGDDFVVLFKSRNPEAICQSIIDEFDRLVPEYYAPNDLANGGITNFDRQGGKQFFPVLALSVGLVQPDLNLVKSHYEVSALAAGAKGEAKKTDGSSIFLSRRQAISQLSQAEMKVAESNSHIKLVSKNN